MSNTTRQFHAAMRGEVRDPDEIDLQPDLAGVGGAGRIPIVGRVGDGAQPAAPTADDAPAADDEHSYDLSPQASLWAVQSAWREISTLRGIALSGLEGEGRRYALAILDNLDQWFDSQETRINLMIAARDKSGGAP